MSERVAGATLRNIRAYPPCGLHASFDASLGCKPRFHP